MMFILGGPSVSQQINPMFTNSENLLGDSRFYLVFALYYQDGSSFNPGIVSSFSTSTGTIIA